VTGERAAAFADELAAVNGEAVDFVRSCSEEQWRTMVPGEDWTVGVVLHHIAEGHANGLRWLRAMSRGDAVTESAEDIDRWNDAHARRSAGMGRAETLALLLENGARTEAALRRLTDEELDRTAPFGPAGGGSLPAGAMAEVVARHAREHLAHARRAAAST